MNTYYNKDIFPDIPLNNTNPNIELNIPKENMYGDIYIEDIINQNKGKQVIIHITLQNNEKTDLKGIIEQATKEYIIISEPPTGVWQLIPIKYINYISFNENINYK